MPKYAASHEFDRRKRDEMFGISAAQSQHNKQQQQYEESQRLLQQQRPPIPQFQSSQYQSNQPNRPLNDSRDGFQQGGGRFPIQQQYNTPSNGLRMGSNMNGGGQQYSSGGPNRGGPSNGGNYPQYHSAPPRQHPGFAANIPTRPQNDFRLPMNRGGGGPAGSAKMSFAQLSTAGARGATVIPPPPSRPAGPAGGQRGEEKPPPPLPY